MAVRIGSGGSMSFGSFNAQLLSVEHTGASRPMVKSTHLGTANNYDTFLVGNFVDGGELRVEFNFDANAAANLPALTAAAATCTVTFPGTPSDTFAFSGAVNGADIFTMAIDEVVTGSMTIKVLGPITHTPGT